MGEAATDYLSISGEGSIGNNSGIATEYLTTSCPNMSEGDGGDGEGLIPLSFTADEYVISQNYKRKLLFVSSILPVKHLPHIL